MRYVIPGILALLTSKLCAHLIADDPYQYDATPIEWLKQEAERLSIKRAWGRLTPKDQSQLTIIERTIDFRARTNTPW